MMSLSLIRKMSNEAAYQAAQDDLEPLTIHEPSEIREIPTLGYHLPEGWRPLRVLFADATGWGREDEPALTLAQLQATVIPGLAYAICEAGQFQVRIVEMIPEDEPTPPDLVLTGKGIDTVEDYLAEVGDQHAYADEREESIHYWLQAAEDLGILEDDAYMAMGEGEMGGPIIVHSRAEAEQALRDYFE